MCGWCAAESDVWLSNCRLFMLLKYVQRWYSSYKTESDIWWWHFKHFWKMNFLTGQHNVWSLNKGCFSCFHIFSRKWAFIVHGASASVLQCNWWRNMSYNLHVCANLQAWASWLWVSGKGDALKQQQRPFKSDITSADLAGGASSSVLSKWSNLWQLFWSAFLQVWQRWVRGQECLGMRALKSFLSSRANSRDFCPQSLDLLLFDLAAILCILVKAIWSSCKHKYGADTLKRHKIATVVKKMTCWQENSCSSGGSLYWMHLKMIEVNSKLLALCVFLTFPQLTVVFGWSQRFLEDKSTKWWTWLWLAKQRFWS